MEYNEAKVDDTVLALLCLTSFPDGEATRAWKGQSWEVMNRLHENGMISDPAKKAKSVLLTAEGCEKSRRLFEELSGVKTMR